MAHRLLADELVAAGLSGVEVRPVRRSVERDPDPDYVWLHIVSVWPQMEASSVLEKHDLCPQCGRTGFFHPGTRPMEWHYSQPPPQSSDFNHTWERFGLWRGRGFSGRGVGGSPGIIVSQEVRQVFERLKVKRVGYVPIVFRRGAS